MLENQTFDKKTLKCKKYREETKQSNGWLEENEQKEHLLTADVQKKKRDEHRHVDVVPCGTGASKITITNVFV